MSIIKVHDLWKSYGKLQVLKGVNLIVEKGETLVIVGRSGGGKSVLLRQIICLEKPDKGYVEVDKQCISTMTLNKRNQALANMGMLFQGAALFDSMNVFENTAFYLRQHPDPRTKKFTLDSELQDRVTTALNMVGLKGAENKLPGELSGGMRKRAALARLIVYRPSILLYDEPTAGLDPITAMHINELIVKTQKELDATSIVVTHDMLSAKTVGNRIAFHNEGKIAHITSTEEFFKIDDPLIKSFLDNSTLK